MSKSAVAAILPARWGSTRLPGKSLHPIAACPLIQHVWERCRRARNIAQIIVATDDMRIAEAAFAFGAEVALSWMIGDKASDILCGQRSGGKGVFVQTGYALDEPCQPRFHRPEFHGCGALGTGQPLSRILYADEHRFKIRDSVR